LRLSDSGRTVFIDPFDGMRVAHLGNLGQVEGP
jgi:hypothetical protein